MKSRLSHQGQKSNCLKGNGFTTGVWSGDNKEVEVFSKTDVNGNGFFSWNERVGVPVSGECVSLYEMGSVAFISSASPALAKMKSSWIIMSRSARMASTFLGCLFT